MSSADYAPGGLHWPKVEAVMQKCGVSKLKAISSLRASRNDEEAAIKVLSDITGPLAARPSNTAVVPPKVLGQTGTPFDSSTSHPPPVTKPVIHAPNGNDGIPNHNSDSADSSLPPRLPANVGRYRMPDDVFSDKLPIPAPVPNEPAPTNIFPPPIEEPIDISTTEWDLRLPEIPLDPDDDPFEDDEGRRRAFSTRRLLCALQTGTLTVSQVQTYLSFFSSHTIKRLINQSVLGYPPMFYVVRTNTPKMVRTWAEAGGDVNCVDDQRAIPLIAYAILMAECSGQDTTDVVITLLSLGAKASAIPPVFYSPFLDGCCGSDGTMNEQILKQIDRDSDPTRRWCAPWTRPILAKRINLTQRYFLNKTSKGRGPSDRQMQVAQMHGATALLGVGYFLIGQVAGVNMVTSRLLSHLALPKSKPLILVFAGPSGHGKTELARRMGELLSLEMETVDCTEMKHESDMFGPKRPYLGYDKGSPVNNFLARNAGRRCIVFLDEFEKTTREVQNALLIPFEEGRYVDRRSREPVDCTHTIWILATNAVDGLIVDFCETHKKKVLDTDDQAGHARLMEELTGRMRKMLKSEFGNPLTGRISGIIPFLPFSPGEAAVVTHKYILELKRRVRQDVKLSAHQVVGNVVLDVRNDGAICRVLAEEGYDPDQGARSLKMGVDMRIQDALVRAYLEEDGQIHDEGPVVHYAIDLARNGVLSVFRVGDGDSA